MTCEPCAPVMAAPSEAIPETETRMMTPCWYAVPSGMGCDSGDGSKCVSSPGEAISQAMDNCSTAYSYSLYPCPGPCESGPGGDQEYAPSPSDSKAESETTMGSWRVYSLELNPANRPVFKPVSNTNHANPKQAAIDDLDGRVPPDGWKVLSYLITTKDVKVDPRQD